MPDVASLLGLSLGGTSLLGLVSYILYSWSKGNCASHIRVGDTELKIDVNQIQEVLKEASSPQERDRIRKEVEKEFSTSLNKIKVRLANDLNRVRFERGTRAAAKSDLV